VGRQSGGIRRTISGFVSFDAVLVCVLALIPGAQDASAAQDPVDPAPATASDQPAAKSLLDLDIEQLAKVEVHSTSALQTDVTSLSRTPEAIGRTPAAIYVVTNEMIRRCGARNVPEVLRTVPGVEVAQINASTWAISMRGFNGRFANKLLVQIDGVAIYTPLHGGVFWERDPVMLEDVERIEIIRGPGGTIWGNNAVNGIINITTKSAKDTKGIYADMGGGNAHRQFSDLRAGGQSGDVAYRVWGANMNDNAGYTPASLGASCDYYHYAQGGFRTDWTPSSQDTITAQGDFVGGLSDYQGYLEPMDIAPYDPTNFSRRTLMTRWTHTIDEDTDWAIQAYYYDPFGPSRIVRDTNTNFDVDFQYHFKRGRHEVVWGCAYRNDSEAITIDFNPLHIPIRATTQDTEKIPSYFAQDTVTLVDDRLFFTVGSKFDNNNVTNFEYQPTAKLAYTPDEKTSLWGAITRAVRTPSLKERTNSSGLQSEDMMAYEVGYRRQATDKYFWELAAFFNRYNNLIAETLIPIGGGVNVGKADTYGFEYNATYQASPTWRLTGSYTFLIEYLEMPAPYTYSLPAGNNPRNMFYLQSGWDMGHDVTLDVMFRYVDSLAVGVDKYFVGDVRLAWRPTRRLELSVVGQNLFDGPHYEAVSVQGISATQVEPSVYGMVSWRY
jgi:iron complex outermembrane recepter protein